MALFGIDVSKWNGDLNFAAIKAAGVRFAMVKASQGHALSASHYLFADSRFGQYVNGFSAVGIPVGAYHFFTASNESEAETEAEFFLSVCRPYRSKLSLYLACDTENYNNPWLLSQSRDALSKSIKRFLDVVAADGFAVCHYTNTDHILNFIDLDAIPYPVWQAHYGTGGKPTHAGDRLAMHQYNGSGALEGVCGKFDLNFGFAPLAKRIIQTRTPLEDQTMDYILRHEKGESILTRLADKLVTRSLRPVHDTSPAHLAEVIRYHCGLLPEETVYLAQYRWANELFKKLYIGMKRGE